MNRRNIIPLAFLFAVVVLLQVVFFRNTAIYEVAFCFVYLYFLLLLPIELESIYVIALGFALGVTIDLFYDTLGLHTAATVLAAYSRKGVLNILAPSGGYEIGAQPLLRENGFQWVLFYGIILITIHHLVLFLIESSNFTLLVRSVILTICSTVFTLFVFLLTQFLFFNEAKRKRR